MQTYISRYMRHFSLYLCDSKAYNNDAVFYEIARWEKIYHYKNIIITTKTFINPFS